MPDRPVRLSSLFLAAVLPMAANAGNGVGVADRVTTIAGVAVPVDVLANDLGFSGSATVNLTPPPAPQPAHGTVAIVGVIATYTPYPNYSGPDSFVYSVSDGASSSSATVMITVLGDADQDGVPDARDNCTLVLNNESGTVANSPGVLKAQLDADGDGYGNLCDGDLNNSGLTTAQDNTILRNALNQAYNANATAAKSDLNGSGLVTAQDNTILRNRLNTAPGPSGLRTGGGTTGESYTVGGTVSGLTGSGLVLQNNGVGDLTLLANGPFAFAAGVPLNGAYSVTVRTQPLSPSQTCAVTSGTGTVTPPNVLVTCTTNSVPLSLNVSGRIASADPLVLQSNSTTTPSELISISGNSESIRFPSASVSGSSYTVTIEEQPKNIDQTCVIPAGGGTGTVGAAVAITVSCTTNGKFFYAVNTDTSKILIFQRNSTTGQLSLTGEISSVTPKPTWVEVDGTGRKAYVTSKGLTPASTPGKLASYEINENSGALTLIKIIDTGKEPRHITLDQTNTYAWVPNYVDDTISSYRLSSTGTPTAASAPVPTGDGPEDVDILTAQDAAGTLVNAYAYVTMSSGQIWTYTINPNGTLTDASSIIFSSTDTPPILVIP